ncbi:MAG: hypothetical protein PSV16_00745 [Flavobacterium sp.]|nr:hypothetical protein [Flavobacterium sp.]
MNIQFENGQYGLKAIFKVEWNESFFNLLIDKDVKEIEINTGKGWKGGNVDFLKNFPHLQSVIIIDHTVQSIQPIHSLHELKSMNISTYCKTPINFNDFPELENCGLEWRKGSDSLFNCKKLTSLFLNRFDKSDSKVFSNLTQLKDLKLFNANLENLSGIFSLRQIIHLRLTNLKKIESIEGIENIRDSLEELEIQRCKGICGIDEIFKLKRFLLLDSGEIESIKGIENLTELKEFLFYESTNILDGDLSPLLKLDKLINLSFQNRRHYSNKREEFSAYWNEAPPR